MLRISPGSRLTVAIAKKTHIPKANQALILAPAGLNQSVRTVALTNVKVISIKLNLTARNPRQLNATDVVIKLVPPTLGNPAKEKDYAYANSPVASEHKG